MLNPVHYPVTILDGNCVILTHVLLFLNLSCLPLASECCSHKSTESSLVNGIYIRKMHIERAKLEMIRNFGNDPTQFTIDQFKVEVANKTPPVPP